MLNKRCHKSTTQLLLSMPPHPTHCFSAPLPSSPSKSILKHQKILLKKLSAGAKGLHGKGIKSHCDRGMTLVQHWNQVPHYTNCVKIQPIALFSFLQIVTEKSRCRNRHVVRQDANWQTAKQLRGGKEMNCASRETWGGKIRASNHHRDGFLLAHHQLAPEKNFNSLIK